MPGLLNWFSTIGWDGINSLFGAIAITLLIPALPFWLALLIIVACQAALGIFGYEAIHQFEKWGAVALGIMFVILTISIVGKADTSLADGFSGADQIGAFIAYVAIVASFVLAWSLYASDYCRYLPVDTLAVEGLLVHAAGHGPGVRLARDPRAARRRPGHRRRIERHDLRHPRRLREHHRDARRWSRSPSGRSPSTR